MLVQGGGKNLFHIINHLTIHSLEKYSGLICWITNSQIQHDYIKSPIPIHYIISIGAFSQYNVPSIPLKTTDHFELGNEQNQSYQNQRL